MVGARECRPHRDEALREALAERWGCPFHDVDRMIESHHACDYLETLSAREIFRQRGEERFHELESQVVCELYLSLSEARTAHVVAVGGRTALNPRIAELLSGIGLLVYIEVSPEEMWARVTRTGVPAFIESEDPARSFRELYQERAPQYRRLAALTVNVDGLSPAAALEKLCRGLEEYARAAHIGR
jgi:shikimate kinase